LGSRGFFRKWGIGGGRGWPVFVKAPDFRMNTISLWMPASEPNRVEVGRFRRIGRWYA